MFDKVLKMSVGFFVSAWVAIYLGPEKFGFWNHAIAFSGIFGSFAALTIESVIIKELVNFPENHKKILGTFFILKLLFSLFTLPVVTTASFLMFGQKITFSTMVFVVCLGYVFQAPGAIDSFYQATLKSRLTVLTQNAAFLLVAFAKILLITNNAKLIYFVIAGSIEMLLASIFLVISYNRLGLKTTDWTFDYVLSRKFIIDGFPLIFSSLAVLINLKIDQVMLGSMINEREVGIYAAATRISELWYFIPVAIVTSMSKSILEVKADCEKKYQQKLKSIFASIFWLSVVVSLFTWSLSDEIINLIFGSSFMDSAQILRLHVWAGIFICFGISSNCYFLAENIWQYKFYSTLIGALSNVIFNLFLIPVHGAKGAAVATVISYFFLSFSVLFFQRTRTMGQYFLQSLNPLNVLIGKNNNEVKE